MTAPSLARKTFTVSRLAEFASKAELVKQTGHDVEDWALVIAKELTDNALDECEEAGAAPQIAVTVADGVITVADNGPGIPPSTVENLVDYAVRTSSRAAYVSPTRGAQGNALQSLIAMPFVLGDDGAFIIESHGVARRLVFSVDPIRQVPKVEFVETPSPIVRGTRIAARWPNFTAAFDLEFSPWSEPEAARSEFLQLVVSYAWFNPHLRLSLEWRGPGEEAKIVREPTDPNWTKWLPSQPTSPHWYDEARFKQLIGAEIAHAEDHDRPCPTVREFLTQFRGLSGTQKGKAICASLNLERLSLADLKAERIAPLLAGMRQAARPIKPRDLGVIGRDHLFKRFAEIGVLPESFNYQCAALEDDGLPYVMEVAFGFRPDEEVDETDRKKSVVIEQLESEPFPLPDSEQGMAALLRRLEINGATAEEIAFLMEGQRVELNAMDSDQFVAFVERKLEENGVKKVIPEGEMLEATYGAMTRSARAKAALQSELDQLKDEAVATPKDLMERVKIHLTKHPVETWDEAVRAIVEEDV